MTTIVFLLTVKASAFWNLKNAHALKSKKTKNCPRVTSILCDCRARTISHYVNYEVLSIRKCLQASETSEDLPTTHFQSAVLLH